MAKRVRRAKTKRGRRYTAAQKAKILAAAKTEGLTGPAAAKRFGISLLTFYRWRGPVRGRRRGPGRPKGSKNRVVAGTGVGNSLVREVAVRAEVRAQIRKMLPQIIREEVAAALGGSR